MRSLLCSIAVFALAAGLDPRADLPRIGNCRTLPNQAACLGELGRLAVGDVPSASYLRFWSGAPTTQRLRLRWDGLLTVWPDSTLSAQEKVVLTTPVFQSAGATDFRVWVLDLRRTHPDRRAGILAVYREVDADGFVPGGRSLECQYEGAEAEMLIVALNKANLSTLSLEKRLIQRCQTDGKLGAGTIIGVPK